MKIATTDVIEALKLRHNHQEWAFFTEIAPHTGWAGRWIDALAMNLWRSKKYIRVAYEVKISRTDFLRELNTPNKMQWALKLSNEFYFAAPKGMIKPEELPEEAGLIEIIHNGDVGPQGFRNWGYSYCTNGCGADNKHGEPDSLCPKHPVFKSRLKVKAPKRDAEEPDIGFIASIARHLQRQQGEAGRG